MFNRTNTNSHLRPRLHVHLPRYRAFTDFSKFRKIRKEVGNHHNTNREMHLLDENDECSEAVAMNRRFEHFFLGRDDFSKTPKLSIRSNYAQYYSRFRDSPIK